MGEAVRVAVFVTVALDVLVRVSVGTGDRVEVGVATVGVADALVLVSVTSARSTPGEMGFDSIEGNHHEKTATKSRNDSRK